MSDPSPDRKVSAESDPIAIRDGAPGDEEAMADYHHRCSIASFSALVRHGAFDDLDPRRRVPVFADWLSTGSDMRVRVAVADDRVIAHVAVEGREIAHLFVDPDHAGRGLGRRLLAIGEAMAAEAGHRTIELYTMVGNAPAIALYESAGWRVTGELKRNAHEGLVYDEHLLVKHLDDV